MMDWAVLSSRNLVTLWKLTEKIVNSHSVGKYQLAYLSMQHTQCVNPNQVEIIINDGRFKHQQVYVDARSSDSKRSEIIHFVTLVLFLFTMMVNCVLSHVTSKANLSYVTKTRYKLIKNSIIQLRMHTRFAAPELCCK